MTATTRRSDRESLLRASGADQVFVDDGSMAEQIQSHEAFDTVLELVGTTTLKDSLRCTKDAGIVCMTGIVGGKWSLEGFSPTDMIPTAVNLTTYSGGSEDFMSTPLEELVQ